MTNTDRKSPRKAANDLSVVLRAALGEDRFPVDVEALAREVSRNHEDPITTIKGVDLDGFEGMLRARRKKPGWQILYSTQPRYRGRERFTLAHEFGHYLLHRRPLTADHYRDGKLLDGFDFECLPLQANEWVDTEKEREEADTFASYLLMPIDDYRDQVNGEEMTRGLLDHVTDRYGVSLLAAVRKWTPRKTLTFGGVTPELASGGLPCRPFGPVFRFLMSVSGVSERVFLYPGALRALSQTRRFIL